MLLFNKDKQKKKDLQPVNIDNKHQEILKSFDYHKKIVHDYQFKYENIKKKYDKICSIPNIKITDDELDEKFKLKCDLDELEKEMNSNDNLTQYFVNTGHILFNYYNKSNCQNELTDVDNKNPLSKSILDFFKQGSIEQPKIVPAPIIAVNNEMKKKTMTKTQMFDKYMSYVDSKYISDKDKEDDIEVCKQCYQQKLFVHAEGLLICQKCGDQDYVFIDCDKPSYKEPP